MVMSQNFPSFFDGIIAGAPVYDWEASSLSDLYGREANPERLQRQPVVATTFLFAAARAYAAQPSRYPAFPAAD
jgi:hypothetical protein